MHTPQSTTDTLDPIIPIIAIYRLLDDITHACHSAAAYSLSGITLARLNDILTDASMARQALADLTGIAPEQAR